MVAHVPKSQPPPDDLTERAARELGMRVFMRRAELNFTQLELANISGVSPNQIYNIERSRDPPKKVSYPRFDTIFKLARAFEVSVEELVKADD
ncbi:MAG: XRE family transcriptional regulator [Myxococcaceae bacterium]|nr:MAG: XRE family transcriptional regulator [Myxococcaceae bacterium]